MLTRAVYVRPPREIANPDPHLLRLRKALYGMSDSGKYWHQTLARVLKKDRDLHVATGDPTLYYGTGGKQQLVRRRIHPGG